MKKRRLITRKLDKIISIIVRKKPCVKCDKSDNLNAAHIFSRSNRSVRWDFDNVICLCVGCHFWAHKNPIFFTEFIQNIYGSLKYEMLKRKAKTIRKWSLEELNALYEKYKKLNEVIE